MSDFNSIQEVFSAFNKLRVLIIGDVMIDSYLWGKVERISPEAPVPVLNVQKRETRLGGAANVALNVQSLGATPVLCSVVGNDADGENFSKLLAENKLSDEGIIKSNFRITTIKHRIMSGAHHLLRVDQETEKNINAEEVKELLVRIKFLLDTCDVVVFEDYDKGVLSEEVISQVIDMARSKNIPTVVDPKKKNFLHYKGATLFKPNKKEIREGLKLDSDLHDIKEITEAADILKTTLGVESVLLTLSEKGIFIYKEKEVHHLPAHIRKIADVSGAGDTVISTAALCVALGLPARTVASLSNLAGGLVCQQVGVVPVNKEELLKEAIELGVL